MWLGHDHRRSGQSFRDGESEGRASGADMLKPDVAAMFPLRSRGQGLSIHNVKVTHPIKIDCVRLDWPTTIGTCHGRCRRGRKLVAGRRFKTSQGRTVAAEQSPTNDSFRSRRGCCRGYQSYLNI